MLPRPLQIPTLLIFVWLLSLPVRAQQVIPLWEHGAPGKRLEQAEGSKDMRETGREDRWLSNVSDPEITFFPAPEGKANGTTVLVLPGGGFRYVCIDKEGLEPARWLNEQGMHAAVLKYRTLGEDEERTWRNIDRYYGDALRAMRVLRLHCVDLKLNPHKIGVMGFSAGAMMALNLVGNEDNGSLKAEDTVERMRNRADFVILVYGAPVSTKLPALGSGSAPCLLVHAKDDPKAKYSGAKKILKLLNERKVPHKAFLYETGGHGFGMFPKEGDVVRWKEDCLSWLKEIGMR